MQHQACRIYWTKPATSGSSKTDFGCSPWASLARNSASPRCLPRSANDRNSFSPWTNRLKPRPLAAVVRHAARIGVPAQRLLVDFHTKFSQPAIAFVMVWLAIPFAIRVRRGGVAIGFGASVAIALVYLTLFGIAVTLGDAGRLAPSLAAWLTNLVFLAGGITLFLKTPT